MKVAGLDTRRRVVLRAAVLLITLFAGLSLWYVMHAAWADAKTLHAHATVNGWRDGSITGFNPELWEKTHAALASALESTPGNASAHADLGFLYAARSQGLGKVPIGSAGYALQQSLMDEAIAHYRAACAMRPTFPYTWVYLAQLKHLRGYHDDEFWAAFDHALQYSHSEATLQRVLAEVAFDLWPQLGADRQSSIKNRIAKAQRAGIELPLQLQRLGD